jgi:hypothetical protein
MPCSVNKSAVAFCPSPEDEKKQIHMKTGSKNIRNEKYVHFLSLPRLFVVVVAVTLMCY